MNPHLLPFVHGQHIGQHIGQLALAATLACGLTANASAQTSPYYIGVSQYVGHDSNVYRLGDSQSLAGNPSLSKSDTISVTSLVAGVDQAFGRQRLYGSGSLRANRYQNNDRLNGETYGVNLALDWATVARLSGTLSVMADQSLSQFNSNAQGGAVLTTKNLEKTEQVMSRVRLGVVTRYTAEAMLAYRQRSYSTPAYDRLTFNETSGSVGLRYRPSNLLNLGAALRLTQVDYPRFAVLPAGGFASDRLNRQDIDLTADWQPSGNSQVLLRLSPTRTQYDRNTSSDYSGLTGAASWVWQATGKLKLTSALSHDTGQSSEAAGLLGNGFNDYSRSTTALRFKGAYDFSAKIALNAALGYARRALVNSSMDGNLVGQSVRGSDNTASLSLGARWMPLRSTQLGCDLSTERRRTNHTEPRLPPPMSATTFGCYGQFTLQ